MKLGIYLLHLAFIILVPFFAIAQEKGNFVMKPIGDEAFEVMRQIFEYDRDVPLSPKIIRTTEEETYIREKIVFTGNRNSRVPGYLAIPLGYVGPRPCIILLHGLGETKDNWWDPASPGSSLISFLISDGYAVLTLDAENHGERISNNDYESPVETRFKRQWVYTIRDSYIQSIIEHRRAIDYLATREDIDISKIGMIGSSMGGFSTFSLSAIDERIKVSVACVTPTIELPYALNAAYHYAPRISQPFLMLNGKTDPTNTTGEATQLQSLIGSKTKDLIFFESGHRLPKEWILPAKNWIIKYLN